MRSFFLLLLFHVACIASGQTDTTKRLDEVKKKLDAHTASTSSILTNPAYRSLHPLTSFRDQIKNHADNSVLMISEDQEPGKKIKVTGTVKDKDGKAVASALVYLYQTDTRGWYAADAPHVNLREGDMRHARLFGYALTDKNGQFILHTIKPSGYPQSDLPAHIHVHISAEGYQPYVTEFLFDDDKRLVGEIREQAKGNHFVIAKSENSGPPFAQQFFYTVYLQKQ
jgi:protocatechuate 3,4-dioxygenase beta subunit